eukprot:6212786-Pleurochrysis_carterae.AAC.1
MAVLANTAASRPRAVQYARQDLIFQNHACLGWHVLAKLNFNRDLPRATIRTGAVRGAGAGAGAGRTYRVVLGWWRSQAVSAMRATTYGIPELEERSASAPLLLWPCGAIAKWMGNCLCMRAKGAARCDGFRCCGARQGQKGN